MKATDLIGKTNQLAIKLSIEGDSLCIDAPKASLTPNIKKEIANNKQEIIEILKEQEWYARHQSTMLTKQRGQVPPSHTFIGECKYCGPVWLFSQTNGVLDICPWCRNRKEGWPIPRPE
tara:strand:+ start:870 stop:1226 length:357 start_codon:yes stop_codon:yes gene_type:complete